MRAAAFLAAFAFAGQPQPAVPGWLSAQARYFLNDVGHGQTTIVEVRLRRRYQGKLVDTVWARGSFSCAYCGSKRYTRAVVNFTVRTHSIVGFHLYD